MSVRRHPPILNYEITGSGPTVVLLHGFMASTKYWSNVTRQLSQRHRVVAIDLLGFGGSPKPAFSRYDYAAHLRSLEATLEDAGVSGRFKLMGHSMGSLMALRYTLEHEDRVERLVLTNMPIWLSAKEARADVLGMHPIFKYVLNPALHHVFWTIFRVIIKRQLLPSRVGADLVKRAEYIFQSTAAARLRSLRNVIYDAKVEADLTALSVKTTLLAGLNDRAAYGRNLMQLALAGNVEAQSIPGGHHLPLTHPELVARLIS